MGNKERVSVNIVIWEVRRFLFFTKRLLCIRYNLDKYVCKDGNDYRFVSVDSVGPNASISILLTHAEYFEGCAFLRDAVHNKKKYKLSDQEFINEYLKVVGKYNG